MEIRSLNCTSCGAPIRIPSDLDQITCSHCGTSLIVQRGDGYIALRLADQVSKSINDAGEKTQSALRETSHITQAELKRLQLNQELSSAQIQLTSIQSEIRSLKLQKSNRKIRQQLKELSSEEASINSRIKDLRSVLTQINPDQANLQLSQFEIGGQKSNRKTRKSSFGKGCLTSLLVLMAGSILCGMPAQYIDQKLYGIPMGSSSSSTQSSGPFFSFAAMFITVAWIISFAYGLNPEAKIWKSSVNTVKGVIRKVIKRSPVQSEKVQEELNEQ